jgi:hypothetical protein
LAVYPLKTLDGAVPRLEAGSIRITSERYCGLRCCP